MYVERKESKERITDSCRRNTYLCFFKRNLMNTKAKNSVEIIKGKVTRLHLLMFLVNLVIPIILDQFVIEWLLMDNRLCALLCYATLNCP